MPAMALTITALIGGVALLAYAADQFVLGAARVALLRRIPTLLVGIVIVGFGTSSPELLVSVLAAADGALEISLGNIIGSNIANLSLLLGVGAAMISIDVSSRTVRREGVVTLGAMIVFALTVRGGGIDDIEAGLLLGLMVLALVFVGRRSPHDPVGSETVALAEPDRHRLGPEVARTVLGLVGTVAGAQSLLWGAVDLAERVGLSEGFVGATLVAVGTSLPELVTVIQSARRGQPDLIVGNLLGSSLFNALAVGGTVGLVGTGTVDAPALTTTGVLLAGAVAAVAVVVMATGRRVSRAEGVALVVGYAAMVPLLA